MEHKVCHYSFALLLMPTSADINALLPLVSQGPVVYSLGACTERMLHWKLWEMDWHSRWMDVAWKGVMAPDTLTDLPCSTIYLVGIWSGHSMVSWSPQESLGKMNGL